MNVDLGRTPEVAMDKHHEEVRRGRSMSGTVNDPFGIMSNVLNEATMRLSAAPSEDAVRSMSRRAPFLFSST